MEPENKRENGTENDDTEIEIKIRIGDKEYPVVPETVGKGHVYKSVSEAFSLLAELM